MTVMPQDVDQMSPSTITNPLWGVRAQEIAAHPSLQQGFSWEIEIKYPRTEVLAVLAGMSLVDASILWDTHIERGRE